MNRKTTAIFFILLANIFILAHVAVPHNHIHGFVSFFDEYSHSNEVSHDHHNTSDTSDESQENDIDFCLLNQAVQVGRYETEFNTQVYGEHIIFNLILGSGIEIISPYFLKIPPPFYEIPPSLYSNLINKGLGLRAPPVV
jgi:hypothetical protein